MKPKTKQKCDDALCAMQDAITMLRAASARNKRVMSSVLRKTPPARIEDMPRLREDSGVQQL